MNNERRTDHGRQDRIQIENRTLLDRSTERQGLSHERNVYAMARSQEYRPGLRNGSIFTEFFVAKNPEIVRCSCHSMESVVKKLHFPDGTTPGLMPATWVEFMGIGEKPEPATIVVDAGNDDYRIALDLDTGNCYYQFRDLDEAMGAIWFLSQFIETVNQRKEYRLELAH